MSDPTNSNDVATNCVNGRIGNKTWCKYECCAPMETSIESVCCLEIPEICKPRFSSISWLSVRRSDLYFVIWFSRRENFVIWFPPNVDPWQIRIKVFYHFKLLDYCFLWNILLGVHYHWKTQHLIIWIARSSHSQVLKNLLNGGELYEIHFLGIWKNI